MVIVRRVTSRDAALLRTIRLAALADAPSAFGSTLAAESDRPDSEWEARAAAGATGSLRAMWLALDDGGDAMGLVGGHRETPRAAEVELFSLWFAAEARRRGVARALIAEVVRWARGTGATKVRLWVTCGNDPAESLYREVGFVETAERQPLPSDPSRDEQRLEAELR
jgi:ribosomal protein S18 acetylase RimI-like enzyme